MFLEQQFIIQQAVRVIARLPRGVRWMLTATDEDGVEREDETPETSASLSIITTRAMLDATLSSVGGEWESVPHGDDGEEMYWRGEGDLELCVEVEG
jgi:hypothetical protein